MPRLRHKNVRNAHVNSEPETMLQRCFQLRQGYSSVKWACEMRSSRSTGRKRTGELITNGNAKALGSLILGAPSGEAEMTAFDEFSVKIP